MAKRYEKYKDSGIAWIGEIPEHWEVCRFKFITFKIGDGLHGTPLYDEEGDYYFINGNNLGSKRIELKDSTKKLNYSEFVKYKKDIAENSLLISLNGTIGSVSLYNNEPIVLSKSAGYLVLKTNQQRDFIYHVSNSVITNTFWMLSISGTTIANLSLEALRNTYVVSVPFREQEQLAKYLDWKCVGVDRMVEVRERQIKLLGELRTSVISRAVTRGLNPNAPLKDSGIDWIGQIPEHWEICRLKNACSLKGRIGWKGLRSEEFEQMSYAYLVTGQDFHSAIIDWTKCYQISKERYDEDPYIQLSNGDLLITKDGTIGKIAKVSNMDKPSCLNSGIFVMKQTKALFEQSYLYWLLESSLLKEFNNYTSTGTTILHLYQNIFENMPFIIPSLSEQQQIAEYLDKKTEEIDSTINKFKVQIDKLKEYRQALITEVVTGKIDVRGIEIPTPKSN